MKLVHATDRDLAPVGLSVTDFALCEPYPYLVSTEKVAGLGWDSTSFEEAVPPTVEDHVESDRDGRMHDPGREVEERLIDRLGRDGTTVGEER